MGCVLPWQSGSAVRAAFYCRAVFGGFWLLPRDAPIMMMIANRAGEPTWIWDP
jgi:hypothetical protein